MDDETKKLLFGEYQLIRETAIHFDKILLDIRKGAVTIAFIIFGLAVETFRVKSVLYGLEPIDLAIAFALIEFSMVLTFFYLERHYRIYLLKIAKLAAEYEDRLGLSKDGDIGMDGVSRCLNRVHDEKMDLWSRIAHFNIFTSLMAMGLLAFSILWEFKIDVLSFEEILFYSSIICIILFLGFVVYGLRNIKKQKDGEDILHDDFIVYLFSMVVFVILPYILFFLFSYDFASSFSLALLISIIFFIFFGLSKKRIEEGILKLLIIFHVVSTYLFSWDNIPGSDSERLLRYLRDDHDIGWTESAGISKSDDGKTISIFKDRNSAEIMIDENEEKATLKISDDVRTHDLTVKKKNGKLNIHNY